MEQHKKTVSDFEKCCKRGFRGGQSAFAGTLDVIFFSILRFCAAYFILRQWLKSRTLCLFSALILTAVLFFVSKIIKRNRFEKYKEKLIKDTEKELIKRRLILMDRDEYRKTVEQVFKDDCIIIQSAEPVTADRVFESVRKGIKRGGKALPIISIEPFGDEAAEIAGQLEKYGPELIQAQDIPGIREQMQISQSETEEAIIQKFGKKKRRRIDLSSALLPERAKKYFALGIMLLLLSFVMSFGVYMRLSASAAFAAAGLVFFVNLAKKNKGSRAD